MAMDIHTALGPGLLESAYHACLFHKIQKSGMHVEFEKPMPVVFEEIELDCGFRVDLLIEKKLVIELKSVKELSDIHLAQTRTYLKLGGFKLGLDN
jgi:GxxExxY protein